MCNCFNTWRTQLIMRTRSYCKRRARHGCLRSFLVAVGLLVLGTFSSEYGSTCQVGPPSLAPSKHAQSLFSRAAPRKRHPLQSAFRRCAISSAARGGQEEPEQTGQSFSRLGEFDEAEMVYKKNARSLKSPVTNAEAKLIEKASRLKALDALASGGLQPWQELELISALDLGTIPWSEVPIALKAALKLPSADKGVTRLSAPPQGLVLLKVRSWTNYLQTLKDCTRVVCSR
eukprot:TRINITY_DN15929_c0_g1_i8.p1 TRINITY_DN15929_c0_g1~~TRINITY_DN15929_c0_g1_i8.p1  ORF type:complete len:231 (+),score=38.17 TRINITY_DN15929_c0_g1_i8:3-695(+)